MAIRLHRRTFIMRAGLLGAGVAAGWSALAVRARAQPPARVIRISSKRFEFTPSRIALKKGQTVTLELTALDVPMGFSAPDFHVRADMVPGAVTHIQLTPERAGEFIFLCDVFCGTGHEDMSGTLVVT